MLPVQELFTPEDQKFIEDWYDSYEPVREKIACRKIPPKKVKLLFYGDSIIHLFQIQEFFPGVSFLNRGLAGDTLAGLYFRMDKDIFPYEPEEVIFLGGINCIRDDMEKMLAQYEKIGDILTSRGIQTHFCSLLPLRNTPKCTLFPFQEKITLLNSRLQELTERKFASYIDFHSAMKDENGELKEAYAREDGLHLTLEGYCAMAKVLEEKGLLP